MWQQRRVWCAGVVSAALCAACGEDYKPGAGGPDMAQQFDMSMSGDMAQGQDLGGQDMAQVEDMAPGDMSMSPDMMVGQDMAPPPGQRRYGPSSAFFYEDVSQAPVSPESAAIIGALRDAGGWGNGDRFQIDFSIEVLTADAATPKRAFTPTEDFYSPDCDEVPIPVPAQGNIEGESGYACEGDGDCHLIVHAPHERRLYEMWRADIRGEQFNGGCLAVWETDRAYPETGRGDQCTSADAAGFPIAPLLFTADEVASGEIDHAIRFILPNNRVRARTYVRPATHGTNTTGGPSAPPYGVHFRLRADYPLEALPNEGARVVARALQRYGMYHADGGNIALTAQSDRYTAAKWAGLLGPRDLAALRVEDFEVIAHSEPIPVTYDCQRTPLAQ